ncbi:hypothetical protein, partial [Pyramidobacter piscolens]|uniref:hypothetical protein n=1 Tax=Pyramidobacter piscolens TaxID=638849 RepID=UPI003316E1F2
HFLHTHSQNSSSNDFFARFSISASRAGGEVSSGVSSLPRRFLFGPAAASLKSKSRRKNRI